MTNFFFFQAEDGIRDYKVTGVQTCALPILIRNPRVRAEYDPCIEIRGAADVAVLVYRRGEARSGAVNSHARLLDQDSGRGLGRHHEGEKQRPRSAAHVETNAAAIDTLLHALAVDDRRAAIDERRALTRVTKARRLIAHDARVVARVEHDRICGVTCDGACGIEPYIAAGE